MERAEEGKKKGRKEKKVIEPILARPRYFTSRPKFLHNRPFPSSSRPLFQNEGKCSAFDMEIIFHSHANKTHFHKKGCAPSHILKVRVFGTRNGLLARRSKRSLQKGRFSLKRPIRLDSHNFAERFNCRVRTESLILEKILKFA